MGGVDIEVASEGGRIMSTVTHQGRHALKVKDRKTPYREQKRSLLR